MATTDAGAAGPWRGIAWSSRVPTMVWAAGLFVLLVVAWGVVHAAGGTRTAWPHLFYVPIVAAALPFGWRGGLVAAAGATVACGPLMPLDVAAGAAQDVANWSTRGGFFAVVGLLAGMTVDALRHDLRESVTAQLEDELTLTGRARPRPGPDMGPRLRRVLEHGSFHPVFQPIYALDDGRLLAVEALTRFDAEPSQPPNVWFEQAEQLGMGRELDLAAADAALRAARRLPAGVSVHLNVGPATLRDHGLLQLLDSHRAREVVVEITEYAVIDDHAHVAPARQRLREHGVRLAIDDVGAGFASLRHVVRLAPEIVKLDMTLSRDVRKDPVLAALAEALVGFCARTGCVLVVEGIEEASDLNAWRKLGAHAAQGYLLARPGPLPVPAVCSRLAGPHVRLPSLNAFS